jgi:hypothetical protein
MVRTLSQTDSRVDKFLIVFDISVWLTIITALVLTSALFCLSANYPDRMVEIDSKTLQKYLNIFTMRGIFLLVYPFRKCLELGN